jgi:hypothetical protein
LAGDFPPSLRFGAARARNDKEADRLDEFSADEVFDLRGFGLHCCGIVSALRDSLNEDRQWNI